MRLLAPSLALLLGHAALAQDIATTPVCASAADCVITTFSGCCGGCCPSVRAMARRELAAEERKCASVRCAEKMCAAMVCEEQPRPETLEAECRAGRCVAVPKQPAASPPLRAECREDRECVVSYPGPGPNDACQTSPCGCCSGTEPRAVPAAKAESRQRQSPQPSPAPADGRPKKFGLSQGDSAQPAPACAPCPAPRPARAVCAQGRCALAAPLPAHRD